MEIYREVSGYEGLYEISNYGNVKSLGNDKSRKEKILKPQADGGGHLQVILCKDGKMKHHKVHRLVANAFIDNPNNLPEVNHIDEDKSNNYTENLEWCTNEYNHNYGTRNQRMAETQTNRTDQSIPIDMLTKDGELVRTFPSAHEAMRWLRNNDYPSASDGNIIKCCKGIEHYNTAYGFKWQYSKQIHV